MPAPTTRTRGGAFGFDPSSVPGCILWLDAADASTLFSDSAGTTPATVNGTIGFWRDKSPCLNHYTQATSGSRPTYASISNVSFSAAAASLSNGNSNAAGGWDLFIVGNPLSSTVTWRTLLRGSNTDHPVLMNTGNTALGYFNNGASGFNQFGSLTVAGTATTLIYVNITSTRNYSAALNGTLTTSAAANAGNADTRMFFTLGNASPNGAGNQPWGTLNEILIMSNTTTVVRQQIEGYLAWKWGLQANLPTSHPFKASPTAGRIFTPNDLDQCVLWLDADDPTTITFSSGSNISSWRDKSSSQTSAVTTTAGTYTCTYSAASNSVVFFNGTTTVFTAGNYAYMTVQSNIQTTADYTAVALVLTSNTTSYTNGNIYQNWRNANAPNVTESRAPGFWAGGAADYGTAGGPRGAVVSPNNGTATVRILNPSILMVRSTATSFDYFFNGTLVSRDTTAITRYTTDAGQLPQIGGSWNTTTGTSADNRWYTGQIFELIVYNQALSEADRRRIEGYLIQKWNPFATSTFTFRNYINGSYPQVLTSIQPNDAAISGSLQIWCDATSYSTNNQTLTTWINKVSGGVTLTCAGATLPTVITNQLNGQPIVRFATSSQWYNTAISYSDYTIFFVGRQTGVTNQRVLQSSTNNQLFGYWSGYKRAIYIETNPFILGPTVSDTSWDIMAVSKRNTGQDVIMFWNGVVEYGFQTSANFNLTGISINQGTYGAEASTCEVAEIIIYNSVLSVTQMRQIQIYLAQKWGLSLTPGTQLALLPSIPPIVSPVQIVTAANILIWVDLSVSSTIVGTASSVTGLKNRITDTTAVNTTSGTPTYINVGSYSVLSIPSGAYLTSASTYSFTSSTTCIFIVVRPIGQSGQGLNMLLALPSGNGGNGDYSIRFDSNYQLPTPGNAQDWGYNGSTSTYIINGTPITTTNPALNNNFNIIYSPVNQTVTSTFTLSSIFSSRFYIGYICEIILVSAVPTVFQRQQMEGYLAWKWGIQNRLPTAHPYYKNCP